MGLLEGKVAIISGSGRGIGRAAAEIFAREGASVVVNDLDKDPANEVVEFIKGRGGKAVACPGNVTAPDFGERFVKTALESFGRLDIIVNNAGYTWDAVIQNMTDEQWYAMIDVHATAPFRILRAAAPYIRNAVKQEKAAGQYVQRKIVNVSSLAAYGSAGQVNYSAGKAAMLGIIKTLAKEWGRYNVNANAVVYGWIKTRLTGEKETSQDIVIEGKSIAVGVPKAGIDNMLMTLPLGRAGTPVEAASAIFFFASPLADYVTGQVLPVDGGMHI
ncbi:MAG: SDR family oxidoreductase [Deltaproteobacteria bacterium]|nr:SDR family oxidoreductase [Deltaproteobacteria bacterium]